MTVHPKVITRKSEDGKLLNFKKLAFYHYEFRMSLMGNNKKSWDVNNNEEENIKL